MVNCSIRNCSNRGSQVRFFSFPRDRLIANEWLQYCRPRTNCRYAAVCSAHFLSTDYQRTPQHTLRNESPSEFRILKPDAVPSLHLDGPEPPSSIGPVRILNRSNRNTTECTLPDILPINYEVPVNNHDTSRTMRSNAKRTCSVHTQTAQMTSSYIEAIPTSEYQDLITIRNNFDLLNKNLQRIFTPGQMRCLVMPVHGRVRWNTQDMAAALTLWNMSRKTYEYLRTTLHVPLPSYSTISKWMKMHRDQARMREAVEEGINEI